MAIAIETSGLTKYYGSSPGIIDLDLKVHEGEVFGFIGPNGAGKSTTIRTLLNFLFPSSGSGSVLGMDIIKDTLEIRRRVGYLPGDLSMYDGMTAREFLIYFANLRKCDCTTSMASLAERFQLDLDRKIKDYSTGNRQKVGIVNAFMHQPELLILDEPTSGLDPLMQQEFQELIKEIREQGRTVFLSSHILPEVDAVADRVGIVRESRLIAVDSVEAFKAKAHSTVSIQFASPVNEMVFSDLDGVRTAESRNGGTVVAITVSGSLDTVIKEAANHEVVSISSRDSELEDVFLSYYAGDMDVS
ncbi:MAG: ABC transporter ATP-binding protein [Acidimicrobiia bacterium]|nr:MAG: ABC transporter ATP-binding protein [Acidimicrobiia bacterium]